MISVGSCLTESIFSVKTRKAIERGENETRGKSPVSLRTPALIGLVSSYHEFARANHCERA